MPVLLDDVPSVEFMYFYLLACQVTAIVGESCLCRCVCGTSFFMSLLLTVGSLWIQVFVVMPGTSLESCLLLCLWDILDSCLCYFPRFLSLLLLWIPVFVTSLDSCLCYFSGFLFVTSLDSCLCWCVCGTSLERWLTSLCLVTVYSVGQNQLVVHTAPHPVNNASASLPLLPAGITVTVHSGVHRWSQLRPEERETSADTGGPAQGPVGRTQQAELRKIRWASLAQWEIPPVCQSQLFVSRRVVKQGPPL